MKLQKNQITANLTLVPGLNVITVVGRTEEIITINYTKSIVTDAEARVNYEQQVIQLLMVKDKIPAAIQFTSDEEVYSYWINKPVVNQLGFLYGLGVKITIDGEVFQCTNPESKLLRYTFIKGHKGMTPHLAKMMPETIEYPEYIIEYNNYVATNIKKANKEVWAHAEEFYRAVSETKFKKAVVIQPNKKVYQETHREYVAAQDVARLIKPIIFKNAYTGQPELMKIADMVMTPERQLMLDTFRRPFNLDNDNFEVWTTSKWTEHGYAMDITQVFDTPRERSFGGGYAGGSGKDYIKDGKVKYNNASAEYAAHGSGSKVFTNPVYYQEKAYYNYYLLRLMLKYGTELMDEDYTVCPVCKQPTRKDRAFCQVCGKLRPDAKEALDKSVDNVIDIIKRNNASMKLLEYKQDSIYNCIIEELGFVDTEFNGTEFIQKEDIKERVEVYAEVKPTVKSGNRKADRHISE